MDGAGLTPTEAISPAAARDVAQATGPARPLTSAASGPARPLSRALTRNPLSNRFHTCGSPARQEVYASKSARRGSIHYRVGSLSRVRWRHLRVWNCVIFLNMAAAGTHGHSSAVAREMASYSYHQLCIGSSRLNRKMKKAITQPQMVVAGWIRWCHYLFHGRRIRVAGGGGGGRRGSCPSYQIYGGA